jgi:hypothetical protein
VLGKFKKHIWTQRKKIKQEMLIFFKRNKLVHYLLGSVIFNNIGQHLKTNTNSVLLKN